MARSVPAAVRTVRAAMLVAAELLVAVALLGCDRRAVVSSCDDDLQGVWIADGDKRWSLIDHGKTVEAYPLFDDAAPPGAPRVIDLERRDKLAGEVKRRYMQRGDECVSKAPIRIAKCKDDTLQVVVGEPQPPLGFSPCTWGQPAPSRVEHWRRN